jgi:hypothetical protein
MRNPLSEGGGGYRKIGEMLETPTADSGAVLEFLGSGGVATS